MDRMTTVEWNLDAKGYSIHRRQFGFTGHRQPKEKA